MSLLQKLIMIVPMLIELVLMLIAAPFIFIGNLLSGNRSTYRNSLVNNHIPTEWLGERMTIEDVRDAYREQDGSEIEMHDELVSSKTRDAQAWDDVISELDAVDEIRSFNSGFSFGIALVKNDDIIASVTLGHYSRR